MFVLSAVFALNVYFSTVTGQATVKLDYGTFIGTEDSSTGITSFQGVRFAEPPIGHLRWKAPVFPPTTQLGTVNASAFGNACIPVPQSTVVEGTSEDCLFTNVYVPLRTTSDSKLPVMSFVSSQLPQTIETAFVLHAIALDTPYFYYIGGGFQTGNSQTNEVPLMQAAPSPGMVFVSFEYRLGQFGFLAGSKFTEANGTLNAGLLDQRTGLKWIQRYISKFGGDPTRVTIWGESAGAGSTMFHLIANNGDQEGLFRAAMGDSASLSYMPDFDSDYVIGIFDLFAELAGCSSASNVLDCLKDADANTLAAAGTEVLNNRTSTLFVFEPCIDGTFLTTRPVEAFKSGAFSRVPVLFGSNTDEGANWSAELPNPAANTSEPNATEMTVYNFLAGQWASLTNESFASALKLYPLSDYNNSVSLQGQQMYGEARYICTGMMIAAAATEKNLTSFEYHYDNPDQGSDHGDELTGLFDSALEFTGNDSALFMAMQQYWSSFVISQDPESSNASVWTPVTNSTSGSPRVLLHPGAIAMEDVSDAQAVRCAFWHSISAEMNT